MKLKNIIRDFLAELLWKLSLTNPERKKNSNFFIITFHRVLPDILLHQYPLQGLAVTPEQLEWFLIQFKKFFICMSLTNGWTSFVEHGTRQRPLLAITFDDGQIDNYLYAAPVLDKHNVKGTFFVPFIGIEEQKLLWHDRMAYVIQFMINTNIKSNLLDQIDLKNNDIQRSIENAKKWDNIDRELWIRKAEEACLAKAPDWYGFMSWGNLKELINRGHEIGSHSYSHPMLNDCSNYDLEREIIISKNMLESRLGAHVTSFCYPNGNFSDDVLDTVRRAGYRVAVTTKWGSNTIRDNPFLLNRQDMTFEYSKDRNGVLSFAIVAMRMADLKRNK
jgi:peptidoglycan/xylan/chitin deacetylase (PgdA/CDA1 family)